MGGGEHRPAPGPAGGADSDPAAPALGPGAPGYAPRRGGPPGQLAGVGKGNVVLGFQFSFSRGRPGGGPGLVAGRPAYGIPAGHLLRPARLPALPPPVQGPEPLLALLPRIPGP